MGELDDQDYYSFSFTQPTDATFQLTGLSKTVTLSLFYDSDSNGIFSAAERVARSFSSSEVILNDTWLAGNYLALVDAGGGSNINTKYQLNIVPS